jgi:D-3-phosphoglycerate dehydrogenase
MAKVLISDDLSSIALEVFENRGVSVDLKPNLEQVELAETIGQYDGLAVRSATKITADVIAAAKNLKVIGRAGIGIDNIDVAAATASGIVVMNTPFGNSITTAEHTLAMMFAAARRITMADASTQAGRWEKSRFVGAELYGKTLGLIGCGNIGSIVADRAVGLKMKVVTYDPYLTSERAMDLGVEKIELEELLARADFISLHVPLTDSTRDILSGDNLAKTKSGVIIVNVARGGLVDETALRRMLDTGHVAAAAFDVFAVEPAKSNVLFGARNFVATPHVGASTSEAQDKVARQIAEQMSDYLLTGAVTNALNMPSISAEEAPRLKPFVELAEKLGMFAGQIVDAGLEGIEITLEGRVTELNTEPLICAALAGILRPQLQDVNMVSAPAIVRERGITLIESKRKFSPIYDNLIRIKVQTDGENRSLAGAVFARSPKIVEVKGMALQADFQPIMLYTNNADEPGFIGALGTILGTSGINIGTLHLGRDRLRGEALAIVGVDEPVSDELIGELRALPIVSYAKLLRF